MLELQISGVYSVLGVRTAVQAHFGLLQWLLRQGIEYD